ncbi:hypothetical protein HK102_001716 [Quaeritorhiza haematococci]|nr:hypothetical protein HK102_001716 [Quaeritorhiza haematococci]
MDVDDRSNDQDTETTQKEISLSIEETNKIRISLGLKPLTDGPSDKQKQAEDNYKAYRDQQKKEAGEQAIRDRIEKAKNERKRNQKLKGTTLGDEEEEGDDALAWVQKMKKKESEKKKMMALARKKAKQLEELDEDVLNQEQNAYTGADLKGLRVGHDLDDVTAAGEAILVLKDSTIDENEADGDELINVNIIDTEKTRKNLDNKKKKPAYNAYDDEEFSLGPGNKRKILSQYDEVIDGAGKSGFVIDADGTVVPSKDDEAERQREIANKLKVSLEVDKFQEIKDYYTMEEITAFKKPKKKKKVRRRQVELEPLDEDGGDDRGSRRSRGFTRENDREDENGDTEMQDAVTDKEEGKGKGKEKKIDYAYSNLTSNIDDVNFVDDDDLQSALARARRLTAKQKKAAPDIDIVAQLKKEDEDAMKDDDDDDDEGLVLSATAEFVRNLQTTPAFLSNTTTTKPTPGTSSVASSISSKPPAATSRKGDDSDSEYEPDGMNVDDADQKDGTRSETGGWAEATAESDQAAAAALPPAPIAEEPLVASGMAATVALLSQKGFIQKATPEQLAAEQQQIQKKKWLAEQKKRDLIRELEKEKEKERLKAANAGTKKGGSRYEQEAQRYLEEESRQAERQRMRAMEERFRNFNPDVQITYHDEFGRSLTPKEAFRQLSHKFHGKSSGKLKTERRLKKFEEEIKMQQMTSGDTPLNTVSALQERTKATGSAHVVLSVGNRAVLPADVPLSAPTPTSRTPRPAASSSSASGSTSTVHVVDTTRTGGAIRSAEVREKVTFGLGGSGGAGAKRKLDDGAGSGGGGKRVKG